MLERIRQPLFALRFLSVAICLAAVSRISCMIMLVRALMSVVPPDEFGMLVEDLCQIDGVSKAMLLYVFIFEFSAWVAFVIFGIALFFRQSWARKMIISLIILILANDLIVALLLRRVPINFNGLVEVVFYIAVLVGLTSRGIVRLFSTQPPRPTITTN